VNGRSAVFLDRDGVLNALVPDPITGRPESPLRTQDVHLLRGVVEAIKALRSVGFVIACVSNQPAAAKGLVSEKDLREVHAVVLAELEEAGAKIDASRICLHHPDGRVPELKGPCDCRKPAPGMLHSIATEMTIDLSRSWVVGDTDADLLAGRAAGCSTILIEHPSSEHKRFGTTVPDGKAPDLLTAAAMIVGASKAR